MEIAEYLSVQYYNLIQLEQKYSCIEQSSKVVEEKKSDSIWAFFSSFTFAHQPSDLGNGAHV